jgi:HEPN domain-containing protein
MTASFSMSVELHIANTLRLAHEDLEAAEMLAAAKNRNDADHAQQAAEKILLALLTSEDIKAERRSSHRLDVLRDLLPEDNAFKRRFSSLVFLTAYAMTYRYPKDAGRRPARAGRDELDRARTSLRTILDDVAGHFGVTLTASETVPATSSVAPRV